MSCSPNPVATGRETTCTATVTDTSPGTVSTPTGTVGFELTSGSGSLNRRRVHAEPDRPRGGQLFGGLYAQCRRHGLPRFLAQYGGDSKHAGNILSLAFAFVDRDRRAFDVDERELLA